MDTAIRIRRGEAADNIGLGDVMHDAVRNGPSRYTAEQQAAWVPEPRKGADWDTRLASQTVMIAEQAGTLVGFMTLEAPDYVDFAYIRPDWQGKGVFRALRCHRAGSAPDRADTPARPCQPDGAARIRGHGLCGHRTGRGRDPRRRVQTLRHGKIAASLIWLGGANWLCLPYEHD